MVDRSELESRILFVTQTTSDSTAWAAAGRVLKVEVGCIEVQRGVVVLKISY